MSNFKGIKDVQLIEVAEGDGTPDNPYTIVSYVIVEGTVIGTVHHEGATHE